MLIDTGSGISIISKQMYNELGNGKPKLRKRNDLLTTASGEPIAIEGGCRLAVSIGGQKYRISVVVGEVHGIQGILGMDFLMKSGAKIDLAEGVLHLHGRVVQLQKEAQTACARIRVEESVRIPAGSETFVKATVVGDWDGETEGLVEPLKHAYQRPGLEVPRAMIKVEGSEVYVPITNLAEHEAEITAGSIVASIQRAESMSKGEEQGEERKETTKTESELPEALRNITERIDEGVSENTKEKLKETIQEFREIFFENADELGRSGRTKHAIDVEGNKPIKLPPRRPPLAQREVIEKEVKKMLAADVIEPSDSPWAAPVVLVKKKDGNVRFCVDFRKLNAVTKKDAYPLPRIDESLDLLSGSKWFSTLDLAQGYFQVEMEDGDKEKTAFSTHVGHYQFKVLPFGLCNSCSTFQRLMELTLKGIGFDRVLVYVDDVVVMGRTEEDALLNLRKVFQRFQEANLKLKASKCHLFQKEVVFLGHVVSEEGLRCDPAKIESVKDWPRPENVTEVRSFLGLASYYRKFIPNFAEKAVPLTALTKKNQPYVWDDRCEKAFEQLKNDLISSSVLSYPRREGEFILDTDASGYSVGAVLSQVQDGEERVIAYASKTLCPSRQRYCVTYRELYAVVTFVKHFRHYLWGKKFLIRTDHSSLKWLKNFKNPEGMVARWIATLGAYDFEIAYRKGAMHGNSDALSRKPYRKCKRDTCQDCQREEIQVRVVTRAQAGMKKPKASQTEVAPAISGEGPSSGGDVQNSESRKVVQESGVLTRAKARARIQGEKEVSEETETQSASAPPVAAGDVTAESNLEVSVEELTALKRPVEVHSRSRGLEESTGLRGNTGVQSESAFPLGHGEEMRVLSPSEFRLPEEYFVQYRGSPTAGSEGNAHSSINLSQGDLGEEVDTDVFFDAIGPGEGSVVDEVYGGVESPLGGVVTIGVASGSMMPDEEVESESNVPEPGESSIRGSESDDWVRGWTKEELRKWQSEDSVIRFVRDRKQEGRKPGGEELAGLSIAIRTLLGQWDKLRIIDGVLYLEKEGRGLETAFHVLVAPKAIREQVMRMAHDHKTAGHLGRDKTVSKIKRLVYWPGMGDDVARWCVGCPVCARKKPGPGRGREPMQHVNVGVPLEKIAIDIVGPLPRTENGNEYIMVVVDYFTKWVEAYAIPDHTAQTVADKLLNEFVCRYGMPQSIHTDQGREFESTLFQCLCEALGIDKTRTTPYHPQSDGLVERFNKTLQQMLALFVNDRRDDWDDHIPFLLLAYRSSPQQSTLCTPNLLMFGREVRLPLEAIVGTPPREPTPECPSEYVEWAKFTLENAFQFARKSLQKSFKRQKRNYDSHLKSRGLPIGSKVYRWYPPKANQKLGLGWTGPYTVVEHIGNTSVRISLDRDETEVVVHRDDLKPIASDRLS